MKTQPSFIAALTMETMNKTSLIYEEIKISSELLFKRTDISNPSYILSSSNSNHKRPKNNTIIFDYNEKDKSFTLFSNWINGLDDNSINDLMKLINDLIYDVDISSDYKEKLIEFRNAKILPIIDKEEKRKGRKKEYLSIHEIDQRGLICVGEAKLTNKKRTPWKSWEFKEKRSKKNSLILNDNEGNSRQYYIVVNDIIFKIGKSDQKGHVSNMINFYVGLTGKKTSDSRFVINRLIYRELKKGNSVSFYVKYAIKIKSMNRGLLPYNETFDYIAESKHWEEKSVDEYIEHCNKKPIWNFQEKGKGNSKYPDWYDKEWEKYKNDWEISQAIKKAKKAIKSKK